MNRDHWLFTAYFLMLATHAINAATGDGPWFSIGSGWVAVFALAVVCLRIGSPR